MIVSPWLPQFPASQGPAADGGKAEKAQAWSRPLAWSHGRSLPWDAPSCAASRGTCLKPPLCYLIFYTGSPLSSSTSPILSHSPSTPASSHIHTYSASNRSPSLALLSDDKPSPRKHCFVLSPLHLIQIQKRSHRYRFLLSWLLCKVASQGQVCVGIHY